MVANNASELRFDTWSSLTGDKLAKVSEIAQEIELLDDESRCALLEILRGNFCSSCGCKQPSSGRRCQCWNDE